VTARSWAIGGPLVVCSIAACGRVSDDRATPAVDSSSDATPADDAAGDVAPAIDSVAAADAPIDAAADVTIPTVPGAWRAITNYPEILGYYPCLWAGPTELWACAPTASGFRVARWNGERWTSDPAESGNSLWGSSEDDVWLTGGPSLRVQHFTGKAWSSERIGDTVSPKYELKSIFGAAREDVWTVGDYAAAHWNGSYWLFAPLPYATTPLRYYGTWVSPTGDVWIVGDRVLESRGMPREWIKHEFGTDLPLHAVGGTSSNDVWVASLTGLLAHWDGKAWTKIETGITGLRSIAAVATDNVWFVGDWGVILHWTGKLVRVEPGPAAGRSLSATAQRGSEVWIAGGSPPILMTPTP
jgi:hypothetical protein